MERFPAYDWDKCLHLDIVHYFAMCRHINVHPVPEVRWVEIEQNSGPVYAEPDDDLPPSADTPTSLSELGALLDRGVR
jgi:hypothetical protein